MMDMWWQVFVLDTMRDLTVQLFKGQQRERRADVDVDGSEPRNGGASGGAAWSALGYTQKMLIISHRSMRTRDMEPHKDIATALARVKDRPLGLSLNLWEFTDTFSPYSEGMIQMMHLVPFEHVFATTMRRFHEYTPMERHGSAVLSRWKSIMGIVSDPAQWSTIWGGPYDEWLNPILRILRQADAFAKHCYSLDDDAVPDVLAYMNEHEAGGAEPDFVDLQPHFPIKTTWAGWTNQDLPGDTDGASIQVYKATQTLQLVARRLRAAAPTTTTEAQIVQLDAVAQAYASSALLLGKDIIDAAYAAAYAQERTMWADVGITREWHDTVMEHDVATLLTPVAGNGDEPRVNHVVRSILSAAHASDGGVSGGGSAAQPDDDDEDLARVYGEQLAAARGHETEL